MRYIYAIRYYSVRKKNKTTNFGDKRGRTKKDPIESGSPNPVRQMSHVPSQFWFPVSNAQVNMQLGITTETKV